ncbi:hypothetical protein BDZ88DRAFT_28226 [Geranomyces variabilis]|nr:hypothetical protein BDZ88DRAFT_28226 [Geranomyces variabilis]
MDYHDVQRERRNERRRILFLLLSTLTLSAIIFATLAALFLVRRTVTFDVEVSTGNFTLSELQPAVPHILVVTVHATNENFFPIVLLNATIFGSHPLYNGTLGSGNLTRMTLDRRANTTFDVDFTMLYGPAVDPTGTFIMAAFRNCSSSLGLSPRATIEGEYKTWIQSGTVHEIRDLWVPC